ncbi:MAG: MGMT family protein [Ktedonobacterales bacterium]|nr:MGMT family protein [Ktedonobacterales bacterium]
MAQTFALVRACPVGRVTTYSWLGKALGYPRGARMIGWFMNESAEGVPAQRVVSSTGELTGNWAFTAQGGMRALLEAEGVTVSDENKVDLKLVGWDPTTTLDAAALSHVLASAPPLAVRPSPRLIHLLRTDRASPLRELPYQP